MKRKPVVGTGWKAYVNTMAEAGDLMRRLGEAAGACPEVEAFLFPAAMQLPLARELLGGGALGYGCQSVCFAESGSYTGENSILLLRDLGGGYAEIGHAERRQLFGETDANVNLQVLLCQKHGVVPVVCVGETQESAVRRQNRFSLRDQCLWAFQGAGPELFRRAVLVYEPVWAIGKAQPAPPEYVEEIHALLREAVEREHGPAAAQALRIIYGGSNSPGTCAAFLEKPDIDGLFVGRSALDPRNFAAILDLARRRA